MTSASTIRSATTLSRRGLLAGSAAAAGAFSFGFAIPFAGEAQAQGAVPEINAWVVVHPDDKVVIRIARSEMGQGTLTGLAQLVAEELNCDWSKVTTEYPTPGQNVARNRVWGNFSTGGSRGVREFARICPQGRRGGAHDADPGGSQRMEGAGRRMRGREERDHPQGLRPLAALRPGRGGGRQSSRRPRTSRSRTRRTGPSPASRCRGSTPPTRPTARRSTAWI